MKLADTKAFLEKMLSVSAVDPMQIDPIAVWAAFKLLLYQKVDDSENTDGAAEFLVEWGLLDNESTTRVYLNFVRMFTVLSSDEYLYTLETRCDMTCEAWPDIGEFPHESGPLDRGSLERRIFDLERRSSFRTLLRRQGPWTLEVYHQQQ